METSDGQYTRSRLCFLSFLANDCVSQEEFDTLAQNLAVVEAKLQQWQSTTLDILKQYLLDNPSQS